MLRAGARVVCRLPSPCPVLLRHGGGAAALVLDNSVAVQAHAAKPRDAGANSLQGRTRQTHNFALTQFETEASAAARCSGCVPPAIAMSGLPPPLPPTCCATI